MRGAPAFGRFGQGFPTSVVPTGLGQGTMELQDQFFAYDFFFGNVTTGQTVSQSIPTQADANFLWEETCFYATENGAAEPVSDTIQFPFSIQLTNSGTGRAFFAGSQGAAAVPVGSIAGTGKFPFVLPVPYLITAVSTIQAVLQSLSANTWNNCHLTLVGKKTYQTLPVRGPARG